MPKVRILDCGDCAVTVEFGNEISPETGKAVKKLDDVIKTDAKKGITETIPTFRSLTVVYSPTVISHKKLISYLGTAIERSKKTSGGNEEKTIHIIPICYDGEFAEDLPDVARLNGLTEEEVVNIHTGTDYLIYMIGFLPGFAYLGGLDKRIETPRLDSPRTKIPAGSVGIGGNQTGIYPLASPGGWRLIGKTPLLPFAPEREEPILYKSGEYIRFEKITREEFDRIDGLVKSGKYEHRIIKEGSK